MNMLKLDHLAVTCETLSDGTQYVQDTLGVTLSDVGHHALMSTHNRLLSLGPEVYFEVIAIDPGAPDPGRARWFNLDAISGPPRLTNWILQTNDMATARAALPGGFGTPIALARDDFRWEMAVPENGVLPWGGWGPALIQWHGTALPAPRLPDQGIRLQRLTLRHPDATEIAQVLAPHMPRDTALFEPAETPRLSAVFDTPRGERALS